MRDPGQLLGDGPVALAGPCRLLTAPEMAATFGDAPAPNDSCVYKGNCKDGIEGLPVGGTTPCYRCNVNTDRFYCCANQKGSECKPSTTTTDCANAPLQEAAVPQASPGDCNRCISLTGVWNDVPNMKCDPPTAVGDKCV